MRGAGLASLGGRIEAEAKRAQGASLASYDPYMASSRGCLGLLKAGWLTLRREHPKEGQVEASSLFMT